VQFTITLKPGLCYKNACLFLLCLPDLITTRSWRAGAKLVHEDLGVSISGFSPHSKDLRLQLTPAGKDTEASSKPSLSSEANSRLRHLVNISSGQ
jgi:hypothetical protein